VYYRIVSRDGQKRLHTCSMLGALTVLESASLQRFAEGGCLGGIAGQGGGIFFCVGAGGAIQAWQLFSSCAAAAPRLQAQCSLSHQKEGTAKC
jgi:hypothetical protein